MQARKDKDNPFRELYVKALDSFPVGVIVEYPTTDSAKLPTGYMFCDGSAISRTEYSELFSLIGTLFGSGDGSTTFNIPSKAGLVTAGIKSSDTAFDTIGETLGSKTVTLTVEQMPSHNHAMAGGYIKNAAGSGVAAWNGGELVVGTATENRGGGQSHNNIQPTQVSNFIIKVKPTRVLASTVVNAYNESTENAYSCDYCNKAFGGKILWTNPNPTSAFASQNINIDSSYSDCNYYEILFKAAYNSNLYYNTGKIEIDKQGCLLGQVGGGMYYRECGTISSGVMLIANAYPIGSSTGNNGALIPYKIIGYK